jgi:hypothetical protein
MTDIISNLEIFSFNIITENREANIGPVQNKVNALDNSVNFIEHKYKAFPRDPKVTLNIRSFLTVAGISNISNFYTFIKAYT